MQHGLDALREDVVVEPSDFGKAERDPVTFAAVLERPNELAIAPHDAPRGPRVTNINQDGVSTMRLPRTEEVVGRPGVKRVRIGAATIAYRGKHPPTAVVLEQRRVAGVERGQQRRLLEPLLGERRSPV